MISKCFGTGRKRRAVDFLQSCKRTFVTSTVHSLERILPGIDYVQRCKLYTARMKNQTAVMSTSSLDRDWIACFDKSCALFLLLKGLYFPFPEEAESEIATYQGMESNQCLDSARLLRFKKDCSFEDINASHVGARPKFHNDTYSFRPAKVPNQSDEDLCITGPYQYVAH